MRCLSLCNYSIIVITAVSEQESLPVKSFQIMKRGPCPEAAVDRRHYAEKLCYEFHFL